ncbi:hypothetical protein AA958_28350 [Streptomyces sp. CNQ-509]|uniref:hypothetical protein n=1 Tax=unclassified Streptomyces TaxID=2593676 RepID=UPI00062DD6A2|nr:hypothetical protein [Streptomyces sp. CNQ-509]AKH85504.1 hypothetical protein AA958_28350 [Streptomyces sp. CNQ-509]
MPESVPVRCPACRREHAYTPSTFPCACGAPLTLPLLRGGVPVELKHRTWQDSWVTVRCPVCDRRDEWPRPELSCDCGAVVRLPVAPVQSRRPRPAAPPVPPAPAAAPPAPAPPGPPRRPAAAPAPRRPAFRPVTIRNTGDAVTAAAQYLRWLGFTDLVKNEDRPASGVDVRGAGVVAHVDPTTTPTALRHVECVWLSGLNASALAVFFSLAGYTREARTRADELRLPLYVMDLTGTPQPVNDPGDELIRTGAAPRG